MHHYPAEVVKKQLVWICIRLKIALQNQRSVGQFQLELRWLCLIAHMEGQHGTDVLAGVVDEDYRGEVKVALINHGTEPFVVNKGDRIAQLIIESISRPVIEVVASLEDTTRGSGGFGSTGK